MNIRTVRNAGRLLGKAKELAVQHGDKIELAIDKGAKAADKATKGKYGDRLTGGAEKLKGAVNRAADRPAESPVTGTTSGTGPGAAVPTPDVTPAPAPVPGTTETPVVDPDAPTPDPTTAEAPAAGPDAPKSVS